MMDAAGQDTEKASVKLAQWRATERDFCKQTGMPRDRFRSQVEGFGRSQASRATWDAKKQKLENIKKELISQVNTLDDMLKCSLNRYTGFDATQINSAILHGHIRGSIKNKMDLLDQALEKGVMPEEIVLHRDTNLSFLQLGLPKNPTEKELQELVFQTVKNEIYTSTSFKKLSLPGRDTEIWLTIPKGYKGCQYLKPIASPKYKDQEEVLFARGLTYRITYAKIVNNKYVLYAEVI